MSSFAQTPAGDLDISTGNLVLVTDVPTITADKLSNLFGFFKGEWFRDTRLGFPYLQYVLIKNPNENLIISLIAKVLKMVPGVAAISEITVDFDVRAREIDATFIARTASGATIAGGLGKPFIVTDQGAP